MNELFALFRAAVAAEREAELYEIAGEKKKLKKSRPVKRKCAPNTKRAPGIGSKIRKGIWTC